MVPESIPEEESLTPQQTPKRPKHQSTTSIVSEISPISTAQSSFDSLPISPIGSPAYPSAEYVAQTTPTPTQRTFQTQIPRRKPAPISALAPETRELNEDMPKKKSETKWDGYSGEPSEDGRPPTVRPGAQSLEEQYPQLKARTRQILADLKKTNGENKQSWGKQPPSVAPDTLDHSAHKQPWKGASGRTTLVEPVRNNPAARLQPLRIPERNISREYTATRSAPVNEAVFQHSPEHTPDPQSAPVRAPVIAQIPTIRHIPSQESIKPVAPLKIGSKTPRAISPTMISNEAHLQSPFRSPDANIEHAQPLAATPSLSMESPTLGNAFNDVETLTSAEPVQRATLLTNAEAKPSRLAHTPKSRFSWTTYATTVNASPQSIHNLITDDSPRDKLHTHTPVIIKKRAVSGYPASVQYSNLDAAVSNTSLISVQRKPLAPAPTMDRFRSVSAVSAASLSKTLPQCPPEMEAGDKIATLEARMDDLSRRKRNLNKIIGELGESQKRNLIVYDTRKRREIEKMVTNMKLELAEVGQEEHESGIQLHRAQKKKDREDNYEQPTGLWIKRVTS